MREYSGEELGMLAGAAAGGVLAVAGFSLFNNALFFLIAGVGVAAGIMIGKNIDMKRAKSEYRKTDGDHCPDGEKFRKFRK